MPSPDSTALVHRLGQTTYLDLFQRLNRKLLEEIWDGGQASFALRAIVIDDPSPPRIRFLAAEILFTMDPAYPNGEALESLASIYAGALRDAPREMANPWGLPGSADGPIADHVLRIGAGAVPALRPLLDDAAPVKFSGSREATYGNRFAWRVKDIAASLLARICGIPFNPVPDPSARDSAIVHLKAALETSR
ncbi:MAG TPA: hypothetical protein VKB38_15295 [Terracidiphilus sp.]|nr:hypothetical protein [Terracidiphilus sp.]